MAGILGYGAYIPRYRLKVGEIWDMWGISARMLAPIRKRSGVTEKTEKAVARWDEDSVTMAIQAAKASLEMAAISGPELDAVYFGSCTNPCTSRASAPTIAEALRTCPELMCSDCQFASKSGTSALQICAGLVDAGMIKHGLAVGSDAFSRHVAPNDTLEFSASSGGAAFVVGKEKVIAEIEGMYSYTTLTPDFFRLDGERYIKHAAHDEVEYSWGYVRHMKEAVEGYIKKSGCKVGDFAYVAPGQPNSQAPVDVMKELGFTEEQITPGLLASEIGDCGSASSLLSLEAILDQAGPNERILLVSYGFGAGCDVLALKTTTLLEEARRRRMVYPSLKELINNKEYITYEQSLRQERKLIQEYV